jgi:hypothetical protein
VPGPKKLTTKPSMPERDAWESQVATWLDRKAESRAPGCRWASQSPIHKVGSKWSGHSIRQDLDVAERVIGVGELPVNFTQVTHCKSESEGADSTIAAS